MRKKFFAKSKILVLKKTVCYDILKMGDNVRRLFVDLGKNSYDIVLENSFSRLLEELEKINCSKNVLIVTDSVVSKLYEEQVRKILLSGGYDVATCVFKNGEENKNIDTILEISKALLRHNADRKSTVIALGGGVVGDMAGFAASIYMRGIDFVQIPTTLLSQTDSSVGGKTGIDFMKAKNILGAFHQPKLVYINSSVLKTLPERELISGMGEVIKHSIIRDKEFFEFLFENTENVRNLSDDILLDMIYKNCSIKASVVSMDEKENGVRADLNFGHTFGHAVESYSDFELSHGECVGLGMIAASKVSFMRKLITEEEFLKIKEILKNYRFRTKTNIKNTDDVILLMQKDKKKADGKLKFVLPVGIGKVIKTSDLCEEEIRAAFEEISEN